MATDGTSHPANRKGQGGPYGPGNTRGDGPQNPFRTPLAHKKRKSNSVAKAFKKGYKTT